LRVRAGPADLISRFVRVLRRYYGVRTGQRATGGAKSRGRPSSPASDLGQNYGEDAARIGANGLRVKPGLGAELWRGLAGTVVRQGDVAAMVWSFCTAELGGGTAWFGPGCVGRGKVRHREGSRGQNKGRGRDPRHWTMAGESR